MSTSEQRASRRLLHTAAVAMLALVLGACSTARPWINAPRVDGAAVQYDGLRQIDDAARSADLLVVVSFSGGGSRAAALAYESLRELDAVSLYVDGRETTLAREIDVVTGVSGGSVAAAYLALHGLPRFLERFGADFLDVDFGADLVGRVLSPRIWPRLGSRYIGRGHVLAEALDDRLFDSATFGTLATLSERPYLIVGATDLTTGAEFDFAADQFGRLCSSIDEVPLSFAVAASAAVPIVFTPLTLANHSTRCRDPGLATSEPGGELPVRARLVRDEMDGYSDPQKRYIHLVDGGVSDNLGVRRVVDYVAQAGGIGNVLRMLQSREGRIARHVVFVNVGSESRAPSELDGQRRTPGTLQVIRTLASGGVGRASRATELAFAEAIRQWREALRASAPPLSHTDVYSIDVELAATRDERLRARARAIPTAFEITPDDRAVLAQVARLQLGVSGELERLRSAIATTSPGSETLRSAVGVSNVAKRPRGAHRARRQGSGGEHTARAAAWNSTTSPSSPRDGARKESPADP